MNRHLVRDLTSRGLWTDDLRVQLIARSGSGQHLAVSSVVKELYKTVRESKHRKVLDMTADRGTGIDQSQSMNIP